MFIYNTIEQQHNNRTEHKNSRTIQYNTIKQQQNNTTTVITTVITTTEQLNIAAEQDNRIREQQQ